MRGVILGAAVAVATVLSAGAARGQDREAALVDSWYRRYLGRGADPIGIHDHIRALRRGTAPQTVEAAILASREYYERHGATPEGYVVGLFYDVMGRPPYPDEVRQWAERFAENGRNAVAVYFLRQQGGAPLRPPPGYQPTPDYYAPAPYQAAPYPAPGLPQYYRYGR
jgi:hypothetical protein